MKNSPFMVVHTLRHRRMLSLLVALFIVFSLSSISCRTQKEDISEEALGKTITLAKKGNADALLKIKSFAINGSIDAQSALGFMYKKGEGVPQSEKEAAAWYRMAAEQGYSPAQSMLGYMYQEGEGVSKDYAEAVTWYRKAAEQGDVVAQMALGSLYARGYGNPENDNEAATWLQQAAYVGDTLAEYKLGLMYLKGEGVPQNYNMAIGNLKMAAVKGLVAAQTTLGALYSLGKGVPQDFIRAYAWYNLAAADGDKEAAALRDKMLTIMSSEQVEEAQKLSSTLNRDFREIRQEMMKLRENSKEK